MLTFEFDGPVPTGSSSVTVSQKDLDPKNVSISRPSYNPDLLLVSFAGLSFNPRIPVLVSVRGPNSLNIKAVQSWGGWGKP